GQELRACASAAQDVSDGLLADLGHLAAASKVLVTLDIATIPLAGILTATRGSADVFRLALTAGDDYELVFTAPARRKAAVARAASAAGVRVTRIGKVNKGAGVEVMDLTGRPMTFAESGYEHFRQR